MGVAFALLLVAGAGAVSAPASAAKVKKPTVKGTTEITVPLTFVTDAADEGVIISPVDPASALATMEVVALEFPVTGPEGDGIVRHRGGLSFASANTGITIELLDPSLTWGTGPVPVKRAKVSFKNQINGQIVTLFDVRNIEMDVKIGKPAKNGKSGWKRTDTMTFTGDLFVVNNPVSVKIFNEAMDAEIFEAGAAFGSLESDSSTTVYCKTKKDCTIR
ncbi:MAG: hypothetical protein RL347_434 [Actinomycetota bacterium]|jgi:hypothetical protein